jgi:hypothetical protein
MMCHSTGYNKTLDPLFLNTIKNHDIIALVETHMSPDQPLALDGYYTCRKDRPISNNGRHFGGWAVLIRKPLRKLGIKIIEQSLDYVWLKLCKGPFQLPHDIYICVAYIPPCDSSYLAGLSVDVIEQLQDKITKYSALGRVILMGDLNARTGLDPDFITNDSDRTVPVDLHYITDKQIPTRNNCDSVINARGRDILDLCTSARLRIVNGRKLGDTLGYHTCHKWNGSSVVDYVIVSEDLLDAIPYFKVGRFMADLSDHCNLSFKLNTPTLPAPENDHSDSLLPYPATYKWDSEALAAYQEALSSPPILAGVKDFMNTKFDLDEESIKLATEQITDIFKIAAERSLKKKSTSNKQKRSGTKPKHQPWYNKPLRQQRQKLLYTGQLMAKYPGDPVVRGRYFKLLKHYRKACKKERRLFRQDIIAKLDSLHDSHPKEYWELVKKLKSDNTRNTDKISPVEWLNHFQSLGQHDNFKTPLAMEDIFDKITKLESTKNFTELDFTIGTDEIIKGIKSLKNGKASGPDGICNELLRYSMNTMLEPLRKIFNLVLSSGVYPDSWARGFITPLHKKEDPLLPNNYRGITITSVVGKLFNSILNTRIIDYLTKHKVLCDEQIGFRAKCRTSDHIFVLKALMDSFKSQKKPLYMCFIDLKKAFDSISHPCLLYKLLKMNMNGRLYTIIKNMYSKTILQVNTGQGLTGEFTSNVGVRQGDNLSPTLFNLYINDLPDIFDESCDPVALHTRALSCLLYADDLVLLSESAEGMQIALNKLHDYCDRWGLSINPTKTKALVMSSKKCKTVQLQVGGASIDCVDEVTYLGIIITRDGSFKSCIGSLYRKGLKAMFKLRKAMSPPPKPATCLHLFNHLIKPILLYGSEIWCYSLFGSRNYKKAQTDNLARLYENQKHTIEKCQIKYCKYTLGIPKKADNCTIYGELGVYPLYIEAIDRMMKYWYFLENTSENVLLKEAYEGVKKLNSRGVDTWLTFASNIKEAMTKSNKSKPLNLVEINTLRNQLKKLYATHWEAAIMSDNKTKSQHGRKLRTYRKFKYRFGRESYLEVNINPKWRVTLTRFRVSAHRLMIELGRRNHTPVECRVCPKCTRNEVEDEWHFLFVCPLYNMERDTLMQIINAKSPLFKQLNTDDQLCWVMSNNDDDVIKALARYVHVAMGLRYPTENK